MDKTFIRKLILSYLPVNGYYRFDDIFQILPPDVTAPKMQFSNSHHPLIIEYCVDIPNNRIIQIEENSNTRESDFDWALIGLASIEKLTELIRLLNIVTNNRFFTYDINDQSWFIPIGANANEEAQNSCIWGQQFYSYPEFKTIITDFSKPNCSAINIEDAQTYYNRFGVNTGNRVDLPESINETLSNYFQLDIDAREAFNSSAILFSNGIEIWSKMKSLSFAAIISSIETLVKYENRNLEVEKCQCCSQDKYSVTEKFKKFLCDFGSDIPLFKKYANDLYKMRSKILHNGSLFLGDLQLLPLEYDGKRIQKENWFRNNLIQTTRICLVNWLIKGNH